MPRKVATVIPPTTATPIELRAAEPAPVAVASGKQPIIKANEVIKIGLRRKPADSREALTASMPLSVRTLANSTIRIAFFAASPIIMITPICI